MPKWAASVWLNLARSALGDVFCGVISVGRALGSAAGDLSLAAPRCLSHKGAAMRDFGSASVHPQALQVKCAKEPLNADGENGRIEETSVPPH